MLIRKLIRDLSSFIPATCAGNFRILFGLSGAQRINNYIILQFISSFLVPKVARRTLAMSATSQYQMLVDKPKYH